MGITDGDKSASAFLIGLGAAIFMIVAFTAAMAAQLLVAGLIAMLPLVQIGLYHLAAARNSRNLLRITWCFPLIVWGLSGALTYIL